jgi:hypothetical protein
MDAKIVEVRKPRLTFDNEPYRAGKFVTCADCLEPVAEGTIMRRTVPTQSSTFTSTTGKEFTVDNSISVCPRCVVLNDLKRERRDDKNTKEIIATSKATILERKKQFRVRKTKRVLPEEE